MSRSDDAANSKVSPEQTTMDAAAKVLRAGIWLIRNGYGKMMLLPYAAPSGCAWRCEFHPVDRPGKALYRYSTSSKAKYLDNHCGGPIRSDVSAKALAQAIMKGVPDDIKAACEGDASPETLRWLEGLDTALDAGFLPEAFREDTEDYSQWELISLTRGNGEPIPPQPGYVKPGAQRSIAGRE
ncbi:hypothetical protein [Burkholderia ubonensis]|uniref:hypothetical protein n=1 Tax=Burkholderia ubonensis TaxID=101571 RepID=UPI000B1EC734|nr:hypothetical protein [Burkholderia ubonensis]